jgi:hypothetical protein
LLARVTTSNSQSDLGNFNLTEPFYASFNRIFFHTKTLDDDEWARAFLVGRHSKDHGANQLWHDYLLFQYRNARNEEIPRYAGIRSVAEGLLKHPQTTMQVGGGKNYDEILDKLCWLALKGTEPAAIEAPVCPTVPLTSRRT